MNWVLNTGNTGFGVHVLFQRDFRQDQYLGQAQKIVKCVFLVVAQAGIVCYGYVARSKPQNLVDCNQDL